MQKTAQKHTSNLKNDSTLKSGKFGRLASVDKFSGILFFDPKLRPCIG